MKICWDNIENIYLTKRGNLKSYAGVLWIEKICQECGDPFLSQKRRQSNYCNKKCYGQTITGKNNHFYGKTHTKETINRILKNRPDMTGENNHNYGKTGEKSTNWKNGVRQKNIPLYDTYNSKIEYAEETRKSNNGYLEVKCAYCGKWFVPKMTSVRHRMLTLEGKERGEQRFYCSNSCKKECPTYGQQLYPKDFKIITSREIQPELRQMVFKRDNWTCQKCNSTKSLHCHHLEGIRWEPLESADIDKCITLCKSCHIKSHKLPDCGYHDLRCAA